MRENRHGREMELIGRDHNPGAFTAWMAGGGVKPGVTYGETDEVGYSPAVNPVPLEDFHATMLHLLGFEDKKLIYRFQGLDRRLTGIKNAKMIEELLA